MNSLRVILSLTTPQNFNTSSHKLLKILCISSTDVLSLNTSKTYLIFFESIYPFLWYLSVFTHHNQKQQRSFVVIHHVNLYCSCIHWKYRKSLGRTLWFCCLENIWVLSLIHNWEIIVRAEGNLMATLTIKLYLILFDSVWFFQVIRRVDLFR